MACRREHDASGGGGGGDDHHHHHAGCGHDHDDEAERGFESSLYDTIDGVNVRCLNESVPDSGKKIFKPWNDRLDRTNFLESDADEQLIIHIPFINDVKLKSITVIGEPGDEHPAVMKGFKNRDDIDFDNVDSLEATQEWALTEDHDGSKRYETLISKWNGVRSLTLYIPRNFGADTTKIYYIGLRGDVTKVTRRTVITIAEVAARPEDHLNDIREHTSPHSKTIE